MRNLKMCITRRGETCRLVLMGVLGLGVTVLTVAKARGQPRSTTRVAKRGAGTQEGKQHPLVPALRLARSTQATIRDVKDYEATFNKREWIDGRLQVRSMKIKLRQRPFSVYLRFSNPHEGREVIYNAGRNDGKLQVHLTGVRSIVGTVSLLPTSADAMEGNRYPVTLIGLSNLVAKVVEQWEADMKYGDVSVKYYPQAKLGNVECKVIQTSHSRRRPQVRFQTTRLYIDKSTNLPIRVEQFGFPERPGQRPPLLEEYTYSNIRANVGLKDIDFDVHNPRYDF